jgi:hypothetical protein
MSGTHTWSIAASAEGSPPVAAIITTCRLIRQLPFSPAIFDRHVLAFDIVGFVQTLTKRGHVRTQTRQGCGVEVSDHQHRRLLRMRRKRPRNRRAAEKRDEPAPPHVLSQGPRTTPHPTQNGVLQLEALWPNSSAPGRATEWSVPPTRNNRIMGAHFLNRSCPFTGCFEPVLLRHPPQYPFSTVSTR